MTRFRVGSGYDVHRFDAHRPLKLGGVEIPGEPGLAGHSDADVALHALMDALLGAAGMGDIGQWFPDHDEQFQGADSRELLAQVMAAIDGKGYRVGNADLTVIGQRPRIAPFRDAIRDAVAALLSVSVAQVNVKATTTEGLGALGRSEGLACHAVVLLETVDGGGMSSALVD